MSEPTTPTTPPAPATWHVLSNGTVLNEEPDDSGGRTFYQLQSTRPLQPDDLRTHDRRTAQAGPGMGRTFLIGSLARLLVVPAVLVVVVGFVLLQVGAAETAAALALWVGIPVGISSFVVTKVAAWRLTSTIHAIQRDAGLAPGMVDEIEPQRARSLIETHGTAFTLDRVTPA